MSASQFDSRQRRLNYEKQWRQDNYEQYREGIRRWRRANPQKVRDKANRQYARIKKDPVRYARRLAAQNRYQKERKLRDPAFAIERRMRCRLTDLMRRGQAVKKGSIIAMLGCSVAELKRHIERQFTRGMSWENYGRVWHIDHIIPCAKFDLTDERQQRLCFHYLNLRPLLAKDNLRKQDKLVAPAQMPLLLPAS